MELFELAKVELLRSNADRRHPFRLMQLATFGDYPEIRTVVKRKSFQDWRQVVFTDSRTPKCHEILRNKKVSALFYHPKKKLQLRMRATAQILKEDTAEYGVYLDQVKQSKSLQDYTTRHAPGTVVRTSDILHYDDQIHLAVIVLTPVEIDILQLARAGHTRALFSQKDNIWQANMLIP